MAIFNSFLLNYQRVNVWNHHDLHFDCGLKDQWVTTMGFCRGLSMKWRAVVWGIAQVAKRGRNTPSVKLKAFSCVRIQVLSWRTRSGPQKRCGNGEQGRDTPSISCCTKYFPGLISHETPGRLAMTCGAYDLAVTACAKHVRCDVYQNMLYISWYILTGAKAIVFQI